VKANQATHPVRVMCRLLKVSASGFYAWDERPLSARARADIGLTVRIHAIHRRSRGSYGAPNIHMELADDHNIFVGKKRVARLMRAAGLQGVMPKRFVRTTVSDAANAVSIDLVDRQFKASGPDQLWVADISFVATWRGVVYVAFVIDVFARRIVGWRVWNSLKTDLVLDALEQALYARTGTEGLVHHSDRGSQYLSIRYTERLAEAGIASSVGSVGDSYDNALAETIISLYKTEVIRSRSPWKNIDEVEYATLEWVDWFNHRRLLQPIGDIPPAEFEQAYYDQLEGQALAA